MESKGCLLMSPQDLERIKLLEKIKSKKITQVEAARLLDLSERQVIRLCQEYKKFGAAGIISKHRGKPSNNRLSDDFKNKVAATIREHYSDFKPTFAHEKLFENHNLDLSVESVRQIMIAHGLWTGGKQRKIVVHQMRQRRSQYGELIQMDGSPHAWFEDRRDTCTLLVFVDDATSKIMQLRFEEQESCDGYMDALRGYIQQHGRPISLYCDKHGVFRVNAKEAQSGTGETQFGRAVRELDIDLIYANTPQAKGRVERMNATLQDRLVKELRLEKIDTIEQANAFLPKFIEAYNRRFAVEAASNIDAHREIIPNENDLNQILCKRSTRVITKNLEVRYQNKVYQIKTSGMGYHMRGAKVSVNDYKGKVSLIYRNKELAYELFDPCKKINPVVDSKSINTHFKKRSEWKPAQDHPWKKTAVDVTARNAQAT